MSENDNSNQDIEITIDLNKLVAGIVDSLPVDGDVSEDEIGNMIRDSIRAQLDEIYEDSEDSE